MVDRYLASLSMRDPISACGRKDTVRGGNTVGGNTRLGYCINTKWLDRQLDRWELNYASRRTGPTRVHPKVEKENGRVVSITKEAGKQQNKYDEYVEMLDNRSKINKMTTRPAWCGDCSTDWVHQAWETRGCLERKEWGEGSCIVCELSGESH